MFRFIAPASIALFASGLALAQDAPELAVFGSRAAQKGLWKMELLDASDKRMLANAKAMASMGICMDAASEMAKELTGKKDPKEPKCKTTVLRNTKSVAQMQIDCPGGQQTNITISQDRADAFLFEMASTSKSGEKTTMKGRYHYAGECKGDSVVQLEKSSPQCAQMAAQMAKMDPAKQCGTLSGDAKANCESQMKAAIAQMAKMCQ
jgi:hypothetical protein